MAGTGNAFDLLTPKNASWSSNVVAWWNPRDTSKINASAISWTDEIGGYTASGSYPGAAYRSGPLGAIFPAFFFDPLDYGVNPLSYSYTSTFPSGTSASTLAAVMYNTDASTTYDGVAWGSNSTFAQREIYCSSGIATAYGGSNLGGFNISSSPGGAIVFQVASGASPTGTYTANGQLTPTTATLTSNSTPASGIVQIGGGRIAGSNGFEGYIQDVVILNSTMTTTQRQQLEGFLCWANGLQTITGGVLPSGHPYYSAPPTVQSSTSYRPRPRAHWR